MGTINRHRVIEIIEEYIKTGANIALREIKGLPTEDNADWTSCEEDTPDENDRYLVTIDGTPKGEDDCYVGISEYNSGFWVNPYGEIEEVIAWMPLPPAFKKKDGGENAE